MRHVVEKEIDGIKFQVYEVSIRLIKSELLGESPGSNFAFNAGSSTMAICSIIANFLTYRGKNGILDI